MAPGIFDEVTLILQSTFTDFWVNFATLLPNILAAFIVIAVGWIIGKMFGGILSRTLNKLKLDHWIHQSGLAPALYGKQLSGILGTLLKWYIIIVFLGQAVNLISIQSLSGFVDPIIFYIPVLMGSALVILAGLLIGEYGKRALMDTRMANKELVGRALKFLIVYFTAVIALQTAGFEVVILLDAFRIAFAALAATIAIIVGIGFGFAFKKDAEKILKDLQKRK